MFSSFARICLYGVTEYSVNDFNKSNLIVILKNHAFTSSRKSSRPVEVAPHTRPQFSTTTNHTHGSQADMLCRLTMLHSHCVLRLRSPYRRASKQCCSLRGKMLSEWTPVIIYIVLSVSKWQHIDPQWIVADPSEHKGNKQDYSNYCCLSEQKVVTHLNVPPSAARTGRNDDHHHNILYKFKVKVSPYNVSWRHTVGVET